MTLKCSNQGAEKVFGTIEFNMSEYLGKSNINVELELKNCLIPKTFLAFKITIQEHDKLTNV